ncbi:hypothetical protein BJX76DRAFT_359659 [Aspergillus varians]
MDPTKKTPWTGLAVGERKGTTPDPRPSEYSPATVKKALARNPQENSTITPMEEVERTTPDQDWSHQLQQGNQRLEKENTRLMAAGSQRRELGSTVQTHRRPGLGTNPYMASFGRESGWSVARIPMTLPGWAQPAEAKAILGVAPDSQGECGGQRVDKNARGDNF